jgi:hypothetical protein
MNNNKDFKWIYHPTNYRQFTIITIISTLLVVLSTLAQHSIVTSIVEKHRIYDANTPEEAAWYKKTQQNMNRPKEKKFNI